MKAGGSAPITVLAGGSAGHRLAAGPALGLPTMETQVVVMLASLAVGANVYPMARQFC